MAAWLKYSFVFALVLYATRGYSVIDVSYFELTQAEKAVHLNWEVREGSICNGIQIYRSTDSVHYVYVGQIEGVCGSPAFAQRFSFTDTQPYINQRNYYKLEFGLNEYSLVQSINHVYIENGFFTVENPLTQNSTLLFSQAHGQLTVRIYASNGKLLAQELIQNTSYPITYFLQQLHSPFILVSVYDAKGNVQTKKLVCTAK